MLLHGEQEVTEFLFFHSPGRFHEAYLHCIADGIRDPDTDALLIHP